MRDINMNYNTKLVTDFLAKHNQSKYRFCKGCGISPSTLENFLNHKPVKLHSIVKLSNYLGTTIYSLLRF